MWSTFRRTVPYGLSSPSSPCSFVILRTAQVDRERLPAQLRRLPRSGLRCACRMGSGPAAAGTGIGVWVGVCSLPSACGGWILPLPPGFGSRGCGLQVMRKSTADQRVVAQATVERVVAGSAVRAVGAVVADEAVGETAADQVLNRGQRRHGTEVDPDERAGNGDAPDVVGKIDWPVDSCIGFKGRGRWPPACSRR